jgi:hypothetical protein
MLTKEVNMAELTIEQFFTATEDTRNPIGLPFKRSLDELDAGTTSWRKPKRNLKLITKDVIEQIKLGEVLTYELLINMYSCDLNDLSSIIYKQRKLFAEAGYILRGHKGYEFYSVEKVEEKR